MFAGLPYPQVGGLMAYGVRLEDMDRRAAYYVDRILKGTKCSVSEIMSWLCSLLLVVTLGICEGHVACLDLCQ